MADQSPQQKNPRRDLALAPDDDAALNAAATVTLEAIVRARDAYRRAAPVAFRDLLDALPESEPRP